MCNEGTFIPHVPVEFQKLVAVALYGKVRDPPHAITKNPHDCANVKELHAAPGRLEICDDQSRLLSASLFDEGIACVTLVGKWAEKEFDEFERRRWANVLRKVTSSR